MYLLSRPPFIDREAEEEIFRSLIQLKDDARVLLINDKGGRGKSHLLRRLEYICKYEAPMPVSLVALDQLDDRANRPIDLLNRIRNDLRGDGVEFESFDRLNQARIFRERAVFGADRGPLTGIAHLGGSSIHMGGKAGGIVADNVQIGNIAGLDWTPDMEEHAASKCIETFWADLVQLATDRVVVILLDAVEKANLDLRRFVLEDFARSRCLHRDRRPAGLILVLAGREAFPFSSVEALRPMVKSVHALGAWRKEHVQEFLRQKGCDNASEAIVEMLTEQLRLRPDQSLEHALAFARAVLQHGLAPWPD